MELLGFENTPFVTVKPNAAAVVTTINSEWNTAPNTISTEDIRACWTLAKHTPVRECEILELRCNFGFVSAWTLRFNPSLVANSFRFQSCIDLPLIRVHGTWRITFKLTVDMSAGQRAQDHLHFTRWKGGASRPAVNDCYPTWRLPPAPGGSDAMVEARTQDGTSR